MFIPQCYKCNVLAQYTGTHYICPICGDSTTAKDWVAVGSLADAETRNLRILAHEAIDHIYKNKVIPRKMLYKLLSYLYNTKEFHIGHASKEELKDIIHKFSLNALDEI